MKESIDNFMEGCDLVEKAMGILFPIKGGINSFIFYQEFINDYVRNDDNRDKYVTSIINNTVAEFNKGMYVAFLDEAKKIELEYKNNQR